jgi:hypothetical protein
VTAALVLAAYLALVALFTAAPMGHFLPISKDDDSCD